MGNDFEHPQGGNPTVTFGTDPIPEENCTYTMTSGVDTIVCYIGTPADGDYLVTVATGTGQSQGDEYDLTISAAGDEPTGQACVMITNGCTGQDGDEAEIQCGGPQGPIFNLQCPGGGPN